MVVVPEINAGTASLVATAINPAIGLGTFLAQMVLREPLIARRHAGVPDRRHLDRPARRRASAASPCPSAGRTPPAEAQRAGGTN